jgi:hypothetical protein
VQIKDLPSLCSLNMKMIRYPTDLLWKPCNGCGVSKPNYMFLLNKTCNGSRTGTCKKCTSNKKVTAYHNRIEYARKDMRDRIQKRKNRAVEYMGGRCQDCHGIFQSCVYDFHHIDPRQKALLPRVALRGSWEKAVEELDKCVLLCSNCHRLRHYGEKNEG